MLCRAAGGMPVSGSLENVCQRCEDDLDGHRIAGEQAWRGIFRRRLGSGGSLGVLGS